MEMNAKEVGSMKLSLSCDSRSISCLISGLVAPPIVKAWIQVEASLVFPHSPQSSLCRWPYTAGNRGLHAETLVIYSCVPVAALGGQSSIALHLPESHLLPHRYLLHVLLPKILAASFLLDYRTDIRNHRPRASTRVSDLRQCSVNCCLDRETLRGLSIL